MKFEFSRQAFEKYSISNFMKIRPVGAELFPADGRTDRRDKANSRFQQFCEKPVQKGNIKMYILRD